jgi:uncharacterized protein YndB with AHSA1/START domain
MDAEVRNSGSAAGELVIRRTFNAPRALVFRAWTEMLRAVEPQAVL